MSEHYRACSTCHGQTELTHLDSISGEERELSVTLKGLPVLSCEGGHKQFLRTGFALELLNHLVEQDEPQLPAGEAKGLLFKHFKCADCGQELLPKPDHRHTFTLELSLPDTGPFKVELTTPVYRCGGCGKEQLHSLKELRKLTPEALVHAFKAADIASS